jgi:3-deoxy-D-manno-octulosonate 8-phosphate phosphatase (KDO 8-P phosphatase)
MAEWIDTIARRIRLAVFDVDGVLTDGRLYMGPDGFEMKVFHTRDGHGLKALEKHGVAVAVISGRRSRAVEDRMAQLGIRHVNRWHWMPANAPSWEMMSWICRS